MVIKRFIKLRLKQADWLISMNYEPLTVCRISFPQIRLFMSGAKRPTANRPGGTGHQGETTCDRSHHFD